MDDDKTINEAIFNKYPKSATIEITSNILEQMKLCICKIYKNHGQENGSGFFCIITHKNELIKVLITNHHLINDKYLETNKIIKLSLNDDKIIKTINIDNNKRRIYSNKKYDTTIIEIIENDKLDEVQYLTTDQNIFTDYSEVYCEGKTIYNISYPNGNKSRVSYGIINKIDKYNIFHFCNTDKGSSGSPLLNLANNQVIGIHKGTSSHFEFNNGVLLKEPINEFTKNKGAPLNEIKIKIKASEDISEKVVYFLDNTKLHDNLKELNKTNVELFINGTKREYSKCFEPEKSGINEIKLKFSILMKDCSCMFYDCKNIIDIDFSHFITENVKYMNSMFAGCELKNINLSSFNTEQLVSMEKIFSHCFFLNYVDLSSFNGTKLIYFEKLFNESNGFIEIKINKNFYELLKSWVPKRFKIIFN